VGRGFLQALAATAVVSALLVALLLAAPEQLLGFFQTNAEVMPYAKTYCMIRCAGAACGRAAACCSRARVCTCIIEQAAAGCLRHSSGCPLPSPSAGVTPCHRQTQLLHVQPSVWCAAATSPCVLWQPLHQHLTINRHHICVFGCRALSLPAALTMNVCQVGDQAAATVQPACTLFASKCTAWNQLCTPPAPLCAAGSGLYASKLVR
jgi:hypothetical protein